MNKETPLMQRIQVFASSLGWRLFRNQVGTYKVYRKDGQIEYVTSGLCKGSSDLIGWRPVVITQEMVGMTLAQFVGCEIKDGKAKPTEEQISFIGKIRKDGGLGFVARETEDVAREHFK